MFQNPIINPALPMTIRRSPVGKSAAELTAALAVLTPAATTAAATLAAAVAANADANTILALRAEADGLQASVEQHQRYLDLYVDSPTATAARAAQLIP